MKKRLRQIDYECKVGERVMWRNTLGEVFEGVIIKWTDTVATVKLDDGREQNISC